MFVPRGHQLIHSDELTERSLGLGCANLLNDWDSPERYCWRAFSCHAGSLYRACVVRATNRSDVMLDTSASTGRSGKPRNTIRKPPRLKCTKVGTTS